VRKVNTLILVLFFSVSACAINCVPLIKGQVASEYDRGTATAEQVRSVLSFANQLDRDSPAGRGLVAAISSLNQRGDATSQVSKILSFFDSTADRADIFAALSKVAHVGNQNGFDKLVLTIAESDTKAQGATGVLRYGTTVLNPADDLAFEVPLGGRVVDLKDLDLFCEVKTLDYGSYNSFTLEMEFRAELAQIADMYNGLKTGQSLRLVFSNRMPVEARSIYDAVFRDFTNKPNFTVVDGF
jgi:hypothetical protein